MVKQAVDDALPTPLYHQIYVQLREKILSGDYATGSLLYSESELEQIFKVSRITAKRALDELAAEGLVFRQRGRGTSVIYTPPPKPAAANMEGLIENLVSIAQETDVTLVKFGYVSPPPSIVTALSLPEGEQVQHAIRIRKKEGVPFSYAETYLPANIGRSFEETDLASMPILGLIERSGVTISRARQTITATLADSKTAQALDVHLGSPLLKITRTVFDTEDKPVEFITIIHRPDVYQMTQNLSRAGTDSARISWSTSDQSSD